LTSSEFNINNVSEIPFDFKLRVPRDNENAPEFQVIPETGRIAPFGQTKVVLEICSETVMKYSGFQLVVDVPDVGEEMGAVDILAECCVPKLSLSNTSIDFGNCYLRYPYKALLKLVNESKLPARFEVLPQDSKSSVLGTYTAEPREAGIPAKGEQLVEFVLDVERLGRIQLPVTIKVAGSRSPPLQCTLDCFAMGPSLQFQVMGVMPELADEAAITWGKVPVLAEHEYTLHMYNPTLISADVKAFIEGKASMFAVDTPELRLEPGGTADIRVACNLDEVQPFKDVLHMMVTDGADNCIPLSAVGIGNTVVCEELPALIDLGNQFTNRAFTREYVLRNEGRKSHTLVWSNTVYEEEALRKAVSCAIIKSFTVTKR
jgi:hydrocephalus-inducing protein